LPNGVVRYKIDELLIRFIALPETQKRLQKELEKWKKNGSTISDLKNGIPVEPVPPSEPVSPRPPSPSSLPSPRGDLSETSLRKSTSFSSSQTKLSTIQCSPRKISKTFQNIPKFHFPHGQNEPEVDVDKQIDALYRIFPSSGGGTLEHVELFCEEVNVPKNWRKLVCFAASREDNLDLFEKNGDMKNKILPGSIERLWRKIHHVTDSEALFIRLVSGKHGLMHIDSEGLYIFVLDLIFTVHSLSFLREATEFFGPYCKTVIQRLGFVCRSWNGLISRNQLKKSDFLAVIDDISHEHGDINNDHNFFSYEHFYVIYCKFFELDMEKQMNLSQIELSRYGDGSINPKVFERVWTLRRYLEVPDKMDYRDFVWFILAEEDKTDPTSIEYWFYILDQDGDGLVSMYDLEQFYAEQLIIISRDNIEPISFHDKLTEILDRLAATIKIVPEALRNGIQLSQIKKTREVAQPILDTFLNAEKYVFSDQSPDNDPKPDQVETPWEKFAQEAYRMLISDEDDPDDRYDHSISAYDNSSML